MDTGSRNVNLIIKIIRIGTKTHTRNIFVKKIIAFTVIPMHVYFTVLFVPFQVCIYTVYMHNIVLNINDITFVVTYTIVSHGISVQA